MRRALAEAVDRVHHVLEHAERHVQERALGLGVGLETGVECRSRAARNARPA